MASTVLFACEKSIICPLISQEMHCSSVFIDSGQS